VRGGWHSTQNVKATVMAATTAAATAVKESRRRVNKWVNVHTAVRPLTRDEWRVTLQAYQRSQRSEGPADMALEARALGRLANGDVKDTRYGIRVALRRDLGDHRGGATAYWPLGDHGCQCFYAHTNDGVCSHRLAAQVFRFAKRRNRAS